MTVEIAEKILECEEIKDYAYGIFYVETGFYDSLIISISFTSAVHFTDLTTVIFYFILAIASTG